MTAKEEEEIEKKSSENIGFASKEKIGCHKNLRIKKI